MNEATQRIVELTLLTESLEADNARLKAVIKPFFDNGKSERPHIEIRRITM